MSTRGHIFEIQYLEDEEDPAVRAGLLFVSTVCFAFHYFSRTILPRFPQKFDDSGSIKVSLACILSRALPDIHLVAEFERAAGRVRRTSTPGVQRSGLLSLLDH